MRFKILGLFAAMTVLAACSSTPTNTGASSGAATASSEASLTPDQELKQQVGDRIFFAFNKTDVSTEAQATLERQASFAKKYPQLTFTVEGNCDDRGTREYNLALGERRATADKNALVALGVDGSRLKTISYGKERPSVVGENEAAWAQNRNAITVIN
jgi:peptidoglycan-associated lipoprotein